MTSGRPSNLGLGGGNFDPIGMLVVVIADAMYLLNTLYNTVDIVPTAMQ